MHKFNNRNKVRNSKIPEYKKITDLRTFYSKLRYKSGMEFMRSNVVKNDIDLDREYETRNDKNHKDVTVMTN